MSRWKNGTWKHWTTKEGLRSDRVFTLTIDNKNRLWFSDQNNGLSYVENDSVRYLTTVDGLVSNVVWDLRVDGRGKLWIATRAGLCSYNDGIWSTFDAATGLSNTLIWPILPVENKVYIGSTGGTAILNLDDSSKLNPAIAISGPIVKGRTVYLRWDAFAFWGEIWHDYIDTRYRIDNEQWSSWNKEREKSFGNLSSGNHSFQLQAKSLFGNYDEGGKTVAFTVEPILFLRPIFYAPFGILSAAIVVLVAAYGMRKRRDAVALRVSEEKFRSFVESTKELVWSTGVDGKITYSNPTVQNILGFSPEELEGQNTFSLIHEDDQARVMDMLPQWIANKTGWTGLVLRWRHKNGLYRYLDSNSVPIIDPAGKLLGFRGTGRDITDRMLTEEAIKKSERHFRSIWENSTDGLRLTDSKGIILRVNEAFCRLCEKTKEELEGKPLSVIYKEDQASHILSKHSERFKGRTVDPHLVRHVTLWNGKRAWFEVSNSFFDIGEKEVALLGIFRDVTERKWVESERETLIVELQEALANIKQLSGLLPICASCKKIRDDKGYWTQVEKYIIEHTDAKFTHGVCPECAQKLYPEYFKK